MREQTNLENTNRAALLNVRLCAPGTPQVTLIFPVDGDPNAKNDIASLLLAVFTKMQGSKEQ